MALQYYQLSNSDVSGDLSNAGLEPCNSTLPSFALLKISVKYTVKFGVCTVRC